MMIRRILVAAVDIKSGDYVPALSSEILRKSHTTQPDRVLVEFPDHTTAILDAHQKFTVDRTYPEGTKF